MLIYLSKPLPRTTKRQVAVAWMWHQTFMSKRRHSIREAFLYYSDVIMDTKAFQITSPTIVYSIVYSGTDQREHQCSASLAFLQGIHRWPVNSLHKWPITRKMFPFDDVIMAGAGGCCKIGYVPPKLIINSNLAKFNLSITSISVVKSLWKFALNTVVPLPYSMLIALFGNCEISYSDLSLRCDSVVYHRLQHTFIWKFVSCT